MRLKRSGRKYPHPSFQHMTLAFDNSKMPAVRAILAIVIVLSHFSYSGVSSLIPVRNLAPPAVAIFLFISGYGLKKNIEKKGDNYLHDFFLNRIIKVILPALLVAALHWLFFGDEVALYRRIGLVLTKGNTLLPHYWFVWAILFDYLLFWVCFRFLHGYSSCLAVLMGSILFTLGTALYGFDRCWWICSLAFPTGIYFAEYEASIFSFCEKRESYYWLAIFALGSAFTGCYLTHNVAFWTLCYLFIPLIGALLIARIPSRWFHLPILTFLGTISYEIYLVHITAMNLLRGEFIQMRSNVLFVIAVLAITLAAAFIIHRMNSMILYKLTDSR